MTSRWLFLALCLGACGDARGTSGFDDDAAADTGNAPVDTGIAPGDPSLDAGTPGLDAGNPLPPMDAGTPSLDTGIPLPPTDTGNPLPPTDTGNPLPPTDTGNPLPRDTGSGGVCPPSCQTAADCNPCRSPGDPAGSNYCCMSGLCLFMSGVCAPPPVDAGNPVPTDVDLNFGDLGDSGF